MSLVTEKLEAMIEDANSGHILSKRKPINALLPYAILLEQGGQRGIIDIIFRAARASASGEFMWRHAVRYMSRLFEQRSPSSLDRIITLVAPHMHWYSTLNNPVAVTRWATAALAVQYTEDVGQSVVDALFDIAKIEFLRPHIPIDIWRLLKRRPSLPPVYNGEMGNRHLAAIACIRRLGDIEILKSYFCIVWLDRFYPFADVLEEMESSIREDFGGSGMEGHRKDLLERVEYVLGQLDMRSEHPEKNKPLISDRDLRKAKKRYTRLREVLLEVDKQ